MALESSDAFLMASKLITTGKWPAKGSRWVKGIGPLEGLAVLVAPSGVVECAMNIADFEALRLRAAQDFADAIL